MNEHLDFQLATYAFDPEAAKDVSSLGPMLSALLSARDKPYLVVEVISEPVEESPGLAVAISVAYGDPAKAPSHLSCWLAYTNRVKWCDEARKVGFPIVEADIVFDNRAQTLIVKAARYAVGNELVGEDVLNPAALSVGPLLVIERPMLRKSAEGEAANGAVLKTTYEKFRVVPDAADVGESVLVRKSPWVPARTLAKVFRSDAGVMALDALYPALRKLLGHERCACSVAWTGTIKNPLADPERARAPAAHPPPVLMPTSVPGEQAARDPYMQMQTTWTAARRQDLFGPPRFAFDDVEIVGFRVDLSRVPGVMEALNQMVDGLNFHLGSNDTRYADDFRYAVATPWVVVELLRYRKMRLTKNWPPVRTLDYQAQHELLLRVLVGRVDDDTAQARDAAIHVPAIFVDNPMSKALGREVQGFEKVLASFCATNDVGVCQRLTMDGRVNPKSADMVPLMHVDRVSMVERIGHAIDAKDDVLRIGYAADVDRSDREFERVDLRGVAGRMTPLSGPWRQSDFGESEFRRSFARPVVARGFGGFRSLQISPVDVDSRTSEAGKTWVYGTMRTKDLRYRFPTGLASLELPACANAPPAWRQLRELMGDGEMSFPTGRWYRAQCSMVLSIEDGLRW